MEGWLDGREAVAEGEGTMGEKRARGDAWGLREAVRSSGSAGEEGCVDSLSLLACPVPHLLLLCKTDFL
jgi:hypothetical protein